MCNSLMLYTFLRDWSCQDTNRHILGRPNSRYKFNYAERLGNFLLAPISLALVTFVKTKSRCVQIACVIAGLFAAILGLFGVGIKKLGECANPMAKVRYEAIKKFVIALNETNHKLSEISKRKITSFQDWVAAAKEIGMPVEKEFKDLGTLFTTRVLNTKKGDEALAVKKQWEDGWQDFSDRLLATQETVPVEDILNTLTQSDTDTNNAVKKLIQKSKTFGLHPDGHARVLRSCFDEYNTFVQTNMPLIPTN